MRTDNIVSVIEPIIRQSGTILLDHFQTQLTRTRKGDKGFYTEADLASEEYIKRELGILYPEVAIIAEESGFNNITSDYCWVIDPLDGTTNFAHGLPYFCVSIALTYKGEPQFGIIYQPLTNELFYAYKGKGAFCNGNPMVVSTTPLEQSLLFIGFPYAKGESFLHVLKHLESVSARTFAFRHLGAIALDLAYVADGRGDGVFFEDLEWWDVAAGILLIQEAGGLATTYKGEPVRNGYYTCIAGNPVVYKALQPLLQGP